MTFPVITATIYNDQRGCTTVTHLCDDISETSRMECFACGNITCKACSARVSYYHYGRKRICRDCLEIHLPNNRALKKW